MRHIVLMFVAVFCGMCAAAPVKSMVGAEGYETNYAPIIPSVLEYEQNGLIHMWDAVENVGLGEHSSLAEAWKDLCGCDDLDIVQGIWGEDSFFGLCQNLEFTDYKDFCNAGSLTLEFVFTKEEYNSSYLFYVNIGNRFYDADNIPLKWLRIHDGLDNLTNAAFSLGELYTVSIVVGASGSARKIYVNGQSFRNLSYTGYSTIETVGFKLGRAARIHGCRMYNRLLLAEEIQHNHLLDASRFASDLK